MALADSPDDTASAGDTAPDHVESGAGNVDVQAEQADSGSDRVGKAKPEHPDDAPDVAGDGRRTTVWSRLPRWWWPQPPEGPAGEPSITETSVGTPTTEPTTTEPTTTEPTTPESTTPEPTVTPPTTTAAPAPPLPRDTGGDEDVPAAIGSLLDEPGPPPSAVDVSSGLPVVVPMPPVPVPVIAVPPAVAGSGPSGAPTPEPPGVAPRSVTAHQPPVHRPPPASVEDPAAVPVNFRIGYREYLRTAGVAQIAAVAVPGTVGILLLTALGSVVGYRQAKAGRAGYPGSVARFVT